MIHLNVQGFFKFSFLLTSLALRLYLHNLLHLLLHLFSHILSNYDPYHFLVDDSFHTVFQKSFAFSLKQLFIISHHCSLQLLYYKLLFLSLFRHFIWTVLKHSKSVFFLIAFESAFLFCSSHFYLCSYVHSVISTHCLVCNVLDISTFIFSFHHYVSCLFLLPIFFPCSTLHALMTPSKIIHTFVTPM